MLLRASAWVAAGALLTQGAGLLVTVAAAAFLPLRGYGALGIAFSFVALFQALADLGISPALTRASAQAAPEGRPPFYRIAFRLALAFGSAAAAALYLLSGPIAALSAAPEAAPLLRLGAPVVLLWTLQQLLQAVLNGAGEFRAVALTKAAGNGILLAAFLGFLAAGLEPHHVLLSLLAGQAGSLALLLHRLRVPLLGGGRADTEPPPPSAGELLRFGFPLGLMQIASLAATRFQTAMLSRHWGLGAAAHYHLADRAVQAPLLSVAIVSEALSARLPPLWKEGRKEEAARVLRRALLAFLAGGAVLAIAAWLLARELLARLLPAYLPSAGPLAWLAILWLSAPAGHLLIESLGVAAGHPKAVAAWRILAGTLGLSAAFLAVPFGPGPTAAATALTLSAASAAGAWWMTRGTGLPLLPRGTGKGPA